MYVVEADVAGDNSFNGAVYTVAVPTVVNTAFAPTRTITGSNTKLLNPQYIGVASTLDVYVTTPGQGPSFVGNVLKFTPSQSGNPTPAATLTLDPYTKLAEGIALDASDDIWLVSQSHMAKFGPNPSDLNTRLQDVSGSMAALFDDYGMAIGPTGALYVAGSQYVARYPASANGNFAPNEITGTPTKIASVLAVAVDSFGRVFAGNQSAFSGQSAPSITVYPAGEPTGPTSSPAPLLTITPPGPNPRPRGLAIDGQNNLYVADYGDGAILVYKPPYSTLSASITGLHKPVGIAVR